ncbi:MAG: hypothetical protein ABJC66_08125 [Gammaproteobacteria bacterium]
MNDSNESVRAAILGRLAASREEIRRVLDPPRRQAGTATADHPNGGFPRSRTMQMITSGRGLGTLGAVAVGLLIARPALALRLLRMLPASAVAKTLLLRTFGKKHAKRDDQE